jgi:hypothetical protein
MDCDAIVQQYVKDHDISSLGLDKVYLGAGISVKSAMDKSDPKNKNPCLVANVQSNRELTEDEKIKIENILLKENPYKSQGHELDVHVRYDQIPDTH